VDTTDLRLRPNWGDHVHRIILAPDQMEPEGAWTIRIIP